MKELQSLKQWVKDYEKAKSLTDDLEILFEYFKEGEIEENEINIQYTHCKDCLLYTSPSPRDATLSRMPSSA